MEIIKYYKLISPYPEDITKNCKLDITELDDNFLTFKDNDIKDANFNNENYELDIVKNNGDKITVDLSSLSGNTPIIQDIPLVELSGECSGGVLTLSWAYSGISGTSQSISISGFGNTQEDKNIIHDSSLTGDGTKDNPLKLHNWSNISKGIVDSLPLNPTIGDQYITTSKVSNFGYLYNKTGLNIIKNLLQEEGGYFRVTAKDDWDKMLNKLEMCEEDKTHGGFGVDVEYGKNAGHDIKSSEEWEDGTNYSELNIHPTYFIKSDGTVDKTIFVSKFWTNTNYGDNQYLKTIYNENGKVKQEQSVDEEMYSIRLVADYKEGSTKASYINILGQKYKLIYFDTINQVWIQDNLKYNTGIDSCHQLDYDGRDNVIDQYTINQWDGNVWLQKPIANGDSVVIESQPNQNITYTAVQDSNGSIKLVKISTTTYLDDRNTKTSIDAGWY